MSAQALASPTVVPTTLNEMVNPSRELKFDDFSYWIGVDPAHSPKGDYFGTTVHALPEVISDPWVPITVYLDEKRGQRMTSSFQDLLSGPCEQFSRFKKLCIDSTHDVTFAEQLEDLFPRRVRAVHMTQAWNEGMYYDAYTMLRLGYQFTGDTVNASFNRRMATLRQQVRRQRLVRTSTGKIRIDHHPREHDDLLVSWMLPFPDMLKYMRKRRGGMKAEAAEASGRASYDPIMDTWHAASGHDGTLMEGAAGKVRSGWL